MDEAALRAAFDAHTAETVRGKPNYFTRRMAIVIADQFGATPRQIVDRLEVLGLLKAGSWAWFKHNGGITRAHVAEARADLGRPT